MEMTSKFMIGFVLQNPPVVISIIFYYYYQLYQLGTGGRTQKAQPV